MTKKTAKEIALSLNIIYERNNIVDSIEIEKRAVASYEKLFVGVTALLH